MSVLIKGMKMPKDCSECRFCAWKDGNDVACVATGKGADDCPLIELPYHGDLIEKRPIVDALAVAEKNVSAVQRGAETEKDIRYCQGVMVGYANSILVIDNAPVIIPAERIEE